MDELGSPIFLGCGIQTPCGSSGNLPTFLDRRGAFKWWFLPFSLWKQDWFLHVIVFVLSWLQAFQHLVHLLLWLQMPSKIPSLGRMEKLVFLSNKTREAFRLGPKCAAYNLTTKVKSCYKCNQPMDVGSCSWLSHWKISLTDKSLGGFRHLALVGYQACKIISCIKSNLSKLNCSLHD